MRGRLAVTSSSSSCVAACLLLNMRPATIIQKNVLHMKSTPAKALNFEKMKALQPWAVEHRRYLHAHPELSLQEKNTARYCRQVLADLGYTVTPLFGHGFIADLNVRGAARRIAFRAEMDALPVVEKNTHAFVSRHPGVAHVCGHDVHMSVALFTAKILQDNVSALAVNIRFIFQPSEEELPGGARGMIASGCLEGVDEIYGLHTLAEAKVGEIWIREGVLMGTSSPFTLTITGRGCHAARPEAGLSPLSAAAELILQWQALPQEMPKAHPPILSVTVVEGGRVNNVVPETTLIKGALRAFSAEDLSEIQAKMRHSLACLEQRGYRFDLAFEESYRCVINGSYGVSRVVAAAAQLPGVIVRQDIAPMRFVEDFCYYLEACPGAFYFLGGGNAAKHIIHPLHSPHYDVDEKALSVGARLMATLALEAK